MTEKPSLKICSNPECDSTYKLTEHHPEGNGKGPKFWLCRIHHNGEHGIKTMLNVNKLKNRLKRAKRRKKTVEQTIREIQNEIARLIHLERVVCSVTRQVEKQQILKESENTITLKCLGCAKIHTYELKSKEYVT